ncbi:hypothetical protein GPALN_006674 [Globodera pallida]|nr:hypothetical protein GPALN_006674 [Globodera pallida]
MDSQNFCPHLPYQLNSCDHPSKYEDEAVKQERKMAALQRAAEERKWKAKQAEADANAKKEVEEKAKKDVEAKAKKDAEEKTKKRSQKSGKNVQGERAEESEMEKAKEEREKREQEGKPKLSAGAHRMAEHFANKAFNDIRDKKEEEIPPWGLMSGKTKGEFGGGRKPTPTTMSDHVRDKSPVRKKSRFFWGTPEEKLMKIRRSLLEAADAISEIADELFSYNMKKIEEDKGKEGVEDEKGIAGCSLDGMKEKTQQNFKTDKTGHQRCRYRLNFQNYRTTTRTPRERPMKERLPAGTRF